MTASLLCLLRLLLPMLFPNRLPNPLLIERDSILLNRIQDPLSINTSLKILLRLLAELEILNGHLPHKLKVLLELLVRAGMVVVELHARDGGVRGGQSAEGGHTTAVDVQGADGEEVEEEAVGGLGRVGDVLGEVVVVGDGVEGGWVEFGECGVCVLAVEAFLESVDPENCQSFGQRGREEKDTNIVFQLNRPS